MTPLFVKKDETHTGALQIAEKLMRNGFRAFFVGGAVRDALLGTKTKDIDIATDARPEDIINIFEHTYDVGISFGIVNVVVDNGKQYEVATFREERGYGDGRHPEEIKYTQDHILDSKRRDFTVNSIFYSPIDGNLIDPNNGLKDIKTGVIRTVGKAAGRFSEDHLRILRGIRFAAELDFTIEEDTKKAMTAHAASLSKISPERIRDEINKMLTGRNPEKAMRLLHDHEIFNIIIPEIAKMDGVPQDPEYHPEGNVLTHTFIMLSHLRAPSEELAWAVLLHDIGKPETLSHGDDGRLHFYGHEKKSAEMAVAILSRLRFSNKKTKAICEVISNHMRIAVAPEMKKSKLTRLISSENFPLEIELHRIDCVSSHGKLDNYVFLLDKCAEYDSIPKLPPPLVTGKDLIDLGLKPGPDFGRILKNAFDIQLETPNISKEDIIIKISSKLVNKKG